MLPLKIKKIKLIENDIKLGNLCTDHLHARLVAVRRTEFFHDLAATGQRLALHVFLVRRFFPQVTYFHFAYAIGGRPFDSDGGGGAGILLK